MDENRGVILSAFLCSIFRCVLRFLRGELSPDPGLTGLPDERFQMNSHIRTCSRPGEDGIDLLRSCGFGHGFEALDHGEKNGRIDLRIVAKAEVDDRRRTPGEPHTQADSALVGAEPKLPPPALAEKSQGAVFAVRLGSLEDQGLLRSGCPHQEFGRFPS